MKRKVLMITGSFPKDKCGVGDYSSLLTEELEKKIDVKVLTSTKNLMKKDINNSIDSWKLSNIFKILKEVNGMKRDIVHIQYPTIGYGKSIGINILPLFLRIKGYKVITTIHEYSDNSKLGKIRTGLSALLSNETIVVDERYKDDMLKNFWLKNKKINYVNIASNIPKSKKKKEPHLENKVMGYFGFINESKGIETILEAMKKLKDKNELKTKFLIIAELNEKNEYHKKLLEQIKEFELEDWITITGYLEANKVGEYINDTDYFALPFVNGYSPKNGSMLAALQENKIVITTKAKYDYKDFEGLILLEKYNDTNKLAEIMKDMQEEKYKNHKINIEKFTWAYVRDEHIKIYESM
ncbi:MAG: glycosyltransferase [Clostridium sp.]